jgi:hypothetical protein
MKNSNKLKKVFEEELKKAEKVNAESPQGSGINLYKALIFILKKYNSGNYYGTIALKFTGTTIQNPKELEVTHRLELDFEGD